ncbi:MAG: STAS domain-containing protein [Kouleothrix sp.]|nr:STAS domain-containing protein [Kouleothrix sp.]
MRVTIEAVQGRVPVSILAVHGDLDASTYEDVIAKASELYAVGARHILLDMGDVPFMGSSGIVAIHSIAMMLRGEQPPDPLMGWQAFHSIDQDRGSGKQQQIKILNPQPKVRRTLQMTGMDQFFDILTDRQAALDSF